MADEIDRAQEIEEKQRAQALLLRKPELVACGFCHWCGEQVKTGALFCEPLTPDAGMTGSATRTRRNGTGANHGYQKGYAARLLRNLHILP